MTQLRTYMSGDHRRCDDLLAAAEQALSDHDLVATRAAFGQFCQATQAHFRAEEDLLFPAFEEKTGIRMGPTQMMRLEHGQMRELMAEAEGALADGDEDSYVGAVETLLILMQQHNLKEENVLYPMCDEQLRTEMNVLLPRLQQTVGGAS